MAGEIYTILGAYVDPVTGAWVIVDQITGAIVANVECGSVTQLEPDPTRPQRFQLIFTQFVNCQRAAGPTG